MAQMGVVGTQCFTDATDVAIGMAGKPVRVFSLSVTSDGTAGVCILRNGTSTGGTPFTQLDGTISKTVIQNWNEGLLFPAGCFADVDSHCVVVTVGYAQEN